VFRKAEYELSELVETVQQNLCPNDEHRAESRGTTTLN